MLILCQGEVLDVPYTSFLNSWKKCITEIVYQILKLMSDVRPRYYDVLLAFAHKKKLEKMPH